MAEPKVRILADVSIETKEKLEEIIQTLQINKREFFERVIDEYHLQYVQTEK